MARKDHSDTNDVDASCTSGTQNWRAYPNESEPLQERAGDALASRLWGTGKALASVGFVSLVIALLVSVGSFEQTLFWLTVGLIGALFSPESWLHAAFGNYHHGWIHISLFVLITGIVLAFCSSMLRLISSEPTPPSSPINDISQDDVPKPLPYSHACDDETWGNPS